MAQLQGGILRSDQGLKLCKELLSDFGVIEFPAAGMRQEPTAVSIIGSDPLSRFPFPDCCGI